ncbi:enolase-phosphatase E1 [Chironomus tepperi]|uniref:enolase-phosphatase E1 n=1 Tax=Chironomus tepperi TaxID=113505 RepID=UPI00391EE8FD
MNIKAVICDIEGTTTSISFVKDTLFTYAYENCEKFLIDNFNDPEIQSIIENLCVEATNDKYEITKSDNVNEYAHSITCYVQELINQDRKVSPLKLLQGKIWKYAFESKVVTGHLFEDVIRNFEKWTNNGIKIYIYSSGSVEAQKLLFKYSNSGDLSPYITDYFDTKVGHKQEPKSYENIIKQINFESHNVLFLSDIPKELYAAKQEGIQTLLLRRPNNYEISEEDKSHLSIVDNFDEIEL